MVEALGEEEEAAGGLSSPSALPHLCNCEWELAAWKYSSFYAFIYPGILAHLDVTVFSHLCTFTWQMARSFVAFTPRRYFLL